MSIFIQEVLGLLTRKEIKKEIDPKTDWLQLGHKKQSKLTGTSFTPKMEPYAIKAQDFICTVTKGLTRTIQGSGEIGFVPVYTKTDGVCSLKALKDSIITQDLANQIISVNGNLLVKGDTTLNGNVRLGAGGIGFKTSFESVVVDVNGQQGQPNQVLIAQPDGTVIWKDQAGGGGTCTWQVGGDNGFVVDCGDVVTFIGGDMLAAFPNAANKTVTINHDKTTANIVSQNVDPGFGDSFDAVFEVRRDDYGHVDGITTSKITLPAETTYTLKGEISGTDDYAISLSDSNGGTSEVLLKAGTNITLQDDGNATVTIKAAGGGSPVMTSTVTGTGKLWSDVVQAQPAAAVSDTDQRTYGVQFNDASQLVVNVPWVEGSGSVVVGNPGNPTIDLTSISIDGTVYGIASGGGGSVNSVGLAAPSAFTVTNSPVTNSGTLTLAGAGATTDYIDGTGALQAFPSIPSVPANIVETVDTQNGTYIDMTPTGAVDGDVVVTAELSAIDGADTSGRFLSKDNVWSAIPGGNPGTVTSVGLSTDIAAFQVGSSPITDNGTIELNRNGGTAGQFLRQDGNWADIPSGGTVTALSTEVTPVVADSIDFTVADPTTTPKLTIDFKGVAGQYINGEGQLETFPTIPPASEDVKFKIDAADTVAGYWSDKITIGSGLSGSVNTDPSGEKTLTISAVSVNVVNSIKVGNTTTSGLFEFTGPGVTMDTNPNPQLITFASVLSLGATTAGDALDVAVTNDSSNTGDSTLDFTWAGSASEYINGQGNLVTFPAITTGTVESISTSWPSGANVAMTLTEVNLSGPDVQLNWNVQGTTAQYIDGTFKLQTFPTIPAEYTGWNLVGDLGSAQQITTGNTALIAGGVGLTSTASATDTLTIDLDDTAVTPGAYSNADVTVDQQGRITSIQDGASSARPYKSYVANFSIANNAIAVNVLEDELQVQTVWTDDTLGKITIDFRTQIDKKKVMVFINGMSGEKAGGGQVFFDNVTTGIADLTVNCVHQIVSSGALTNANVDFGSFEFRVYD